MRVAGWLGVAIWGCALDTRAAGAYDLGLSGSVLAFAGSMAVIGAVGLAGFALTSRKSSDGFSRPSRPNPFDDEVPLLDDAAWPTAPIDVPDPVPTEAMADERSSVQEWAPEVRLAEAQLPEARSSAPEAPADSVEAANQETVRWSLALARDYTRSGVEFGWFILVDEGSHEVVELMALKALDSRSTLRELKRIVGNRGGVDCIDIQSHELVNAEALLAYNHSLGIQGVALPADNNPESGRYLDRFMVRFRLEFMGKEVYRSLNKAKEMAAEYIDFCNHVRPDASLGGITPARYLGF